MPSNFKNGIRGARKRTGLTLDQVALLLGYKTTYSVSKFETGTRHPPISTALDFEIIYHTPVRLLFEDLYLERRKHLRNRWISKTESLPSSHWFPKGKAALRQSEFCFFGEKLLQDELSLLEKETVRKHALDLVNASAGLGQSPPWTLT
ncbi:MAG: helix-turn-helix transcriptional regulator [Pyrinomonadaceae bacterium]|nr:helix-turn-helix transcriptional regulator [Pyrinomonadaceae bacterium]